MEMIRVQNLTKAYRGVPALKGVSFSVGKGEILGFLGPNGAGKSTTMRILSTYLCPTSGAAEVAGFDVVTAPAEVRRRIGYLPENVPIYQDMRVREYLRYRADLKGVARSTRRHRVNEVVERTGLDSMQHKMVSQISRGYRQRLGLADALIAEPPVLILDEPTSGLDPNQIVEIRALIRELAEERSILLSTHILPEVESVCGRVVIINQGQLVAEGTPHELARTVLAGDRVRVVVKGDRDPSSFLTTLEYVETCTLESSGDGEWSAILTPTDGRDIREPISQAVADQGWTVLELTRMQISLEEVFSAVTAKEDANAS